MKEGRSLVVVTFVHHLILVLIVISLLNLQGRVRVCVGEVLIARRGDGTETVLNTCKAYVSTTP